MKVNNLPGLRLTVATLALTLGGCNTLPEDGVRCAFSIDSGEAVGHHDREADTVVFEHGCCVLGPANGLESGLGACVPERDLVGVFGFADCDVRAGVLPGSGGDWAFSGRTRRPSVGFGKHSRRGRRVCWPGDRFPVHTPLIV